MSTAEGKGLRDEGISLVLGAESVRWKNAYRASVLTWFGQLPVGHPFTGETLRMVALRDVGEPHHPNCWGGVANGLIRGWLRTRQIKVVGLQSATDSRSHAHLYRVYQKLSLDDGLSS